VNGVAVLLVATVGVVAPARAIAQAGQPAASRPAPIPLPPGNAMANPYRMLPNWPQLGDIKAGGAIGMVPDGTGGLWLQHRSEPGIVRIDASGKVAQRFDVAFSGAHGMCQDRDGNFWALDGGPFGADSDGTKGSQVFKYSRDGKLLLTLGQAGVLKAGRDTFLQPSACVATPEGDIVIADGHWPRPKAAQQDGDRLVWFSRDGRFLKEFGKLGRRPGEFIGPHGLAFDSQGRLFVADRSNNRIQIFDRNMNVVDEWRHFGRPSNLWILKDDTLIVADSESNRGIPGSPEAPEGGGNVVRNPGWKSGIRIGSAKDGSLRHFIDGTLPEGLAADERGNIFGGLTGRCEESPSGGCLQKFVRK
jgi:sugar lactone lactonase YvrE